MNFNSPAFLIFLPAVVGIYWIIPHRTRKYWLLAASYFFYGYWNPMFLFLLLFSTTVDYFCSLGMDRFQENGKIRKTLLLTSIFMNLGLLFSFKYLDFFGETVNTLCAALTHIIGKKQPQALLKLNSLQKALVTDADKAAFFFAMGLFCEYAGKFDEMAALYNQANDLNHSFYLPYLKAGKHALDTQDYTVAEKNYRRAYSISSIIEPLSTVMIPVAAFAYEKIGLELMFLANAVTFFCAASFEVFIKAEENYTKNQFAQGFAAFKQTLKEGISYLKNEKGLLFITAFFCVNAFAYSGIGVVLLPYFKSLGDNGVLLYTLVMGCGVVGRLMGGVMHYLVVFAKEKKFLIAMSVYVSLTLLDSTYLYTPVFWMCISSFIVGVISVTSYNIRLTSTQSYVPDTCRARFNSTFLLLCNVGNIAGQLSAGVVADLIPMRAVVTIYALANLVGALTIMLPNRKKIAPIYNREV